MDLTKPFRRQVILFIKCLARRRNRNLRTCPYKYPPPPQGVSKTLHYDDVAVFRRADEIGIRNAELAHVDSQISAMRSV